MQFKPTHARSMNRQAGQGMSEYIIITALIAVAAIGAFGAFGSTIESQVAAMSEAIAGDEGSADTATGNAQTSAQEASDHSSDSKQDLQSYEDDIE